MSSTSETLTSDVVINDQIVHIRPIHKADVDIEKQFVARLSPDSRHARFLGGVKGLSDEAADAFCDIDYDKKMAFIATLKKGGEEQEIGVARYATDEYDHCEFAITVADEWQSSDLGQALAKELIDFARHKNKELIYSIDSTENTFMRLLARDIGLTGQRDPDDASLIRYELLL